MSRGFGPGRLWLLIPAAAAVAVLPMIVHGPSYGHDFNFHLLNWMEAARQFSHGVLYPRWAYTPAYNAGEPRFVFYPPASWTLGALIGLLLTHLPAMPPETAWTAVPIVFTCVCLAMAGLAMYVTARRFATRRAAAFGAVLYVVNPYMLFTAYERSAYAELLAAAWMPLLVGELLQQEVRTRRIAFAVALLWLTNAPAGVIGCYAAVALVGLRLLTAAFEGRRDAVTAIREVAWPSAIGTALGLGLAGFYLIPAAWERRYVQVAMATIVDMRIDHNFLFEHTGNSLDSITHDAVLRTASWITVSVVVTTILALCACWVQQRKASLVAGQSRLPVLALVPAVAVIAFLLTAWSNVIWQHTPQLTFLQFPWRLLIVLTPVLAIAVSVAISRVRIRATTVGSVALAMAAVLVFALYEPFHQVPEPERRIASQVRAFQSNAGADPTDEYTPQTADNDALTPGNPPYWLAAEPTAGAPAGSVAGPVPTHFSFNANVPEFLILNLRDYPAWRVSLNGKEDTERDQRDDGLIAFSVPAGRSTISMRYVRGFDDLAGDALSMATALVLAALGFRRGLGYRLAVLSAPVRGTSGENAPVAGE